MSGVLVRRGARHRWEWQAKTEAQGEHGQGEMQAEMGVMLPPAMGHQGGRSWERRRAGPLVPSEGAWS